MIELEISEAPIEPYRVLKLASLVQSGGESKHAVAGGRVPVNKAVETRKRKKIFGKDIVALDGKAISMKVW